MRAPIRSGFGQVGPSKQGLSYLSDAGATPEAFGAGIGRALGGLGESITEAGLAYEKRNKKTERFGALIGLSEFQTQAAAALTELQRNVPPNITDFPKRASDLYANLEQGYVTGLPPHLQPEFTFRARQIKQGIMSQAFDFQYTQQDAFSTAGIAKEYERARNAIYATPAEAEKWHRHMDEVIDSSTLSDIEKDKWRVKVGGGLLAVEYGRDIEGELRGNAAFLQGISVGGATRPDAISGMGGGFRDSLSAFIQSAPPEIRAGLGLTSGYRSREVQERLYAAWVEGGRVGAPVAAPGRSQHQHGNAADLAWNGQLMRESNTPPEVLQWVRENGPRFGLGFPVNGEPWHIEGPRGGGVSGLNMPGLPAGMRNNNPGNIKFTSGASTNFFGVVGPSENTDQGDPQIVFRSPEAGMAAMADLALRKFNGGRTTVSQLISANGGWTPGNTSAAANVARGMGVGVDDPIDLNNDQQMQAFMRSLIKQEHGEKSNLYSDAMIQAGISSARTGNPPAETDTGGMRMAAINADPKYADIPLEDRLAMQKNAATKVDQEVADMVAQATAAANSAKNSLFLQMYSGEAGEAEKQAAINSGLFDIDDARKADTIMADRQKGVDDSQFMAGVVANGGLGYSTTDNDRFNGAFKANKGAEHIAAMDTGYFNTSILPQVQAVKDIPTDLVGLLTTMSRSNDSQALLFAYNSLASLEDKALDAFNARVPNDMAAKVDQFRYAQGYMPEEELVNYLRGGRSPEEQRISAQADAMAEAILSNPTTEAGKYVVDPGKLVNDWFDFQFGSPETETFTDHLLLSNEFKAAFKFNSRIAGPVEAMALTKKQLQRTWGTNEWGDTGENFMNLPPEKAGYAPATRGFFQTGIEGTIDPWERYETDIRNTYGITSEESFYLRSDNLTRLDFDARQRGETPLLPSYRVFKITEDGKRIEVTTPTTRWSGTP